ncbi:MAG: enoyl-CoA hydratase/isomerase family protein [Candidatus Schekmanbacteria bacterium]|nr:enoyl-CoA hydratase/isomerase family protein [Candidatus Schekmanbacteria bacterium]
MGWEYFLVEVEEEIALVTINRPKVLNAVDFNVIKEAGVLFRELEERSDVRAIILTGAGEKAFIAGGDIAAMNALSMDEAHKFVATGQRVISDIERSSKLTIAAINGFALGGGTEIAMGFDLRIASEKAMLGLPEVSVGLIAGWGGTQRLSRLIGKGRAKYYIFTGEMIQAAEAEKIGLVNKVVPPEELIPTCKKIAKKILNNSPIAVLQSKKSINEGLNMSLDQGQKYEADAWLVNYATSDRNEGLSAFLEKRKPQFKGK